MLKNHLETILAVVLCVVFVLLAYVEFQDAYTQRVCGANGFTHHAWTRSGGGVCMRIENGNTVTVHRDNL